MKLPNHSLRSIGLATAMLLLCASQAKARLGENWSSFRSKVAIGFRFKGESKKDDRTNYMYSMILDQKTREAAPGFAGALTVTVVNGKIIGQSMLLRFGENYQAGRTLATSHALDFSYESLGKQNPKKESSEHEFTAYSIAIDQVLANSPQKLRYPGFNGVITMSRYGDGDVLIAAKQDVNPPPGGPEPVKK